MKYGKELGESLCNHEQASGGNQKEKPGTGPTNNNKQ
jgi:hypothetical protein